jgi:hypothetical protein
MFIRVLTFEKGTRKPSGTGKGSYTWTAELFGSIDLSEYGLDGNVTLFADSKVHTVFSFFMARCNMFYLEWIG